LSPGSEWLYVKLYASPTTVDDLLTGQIADVTDSAFKKSLIDRWFFVRYADPEFHLRVRFHGHPKWLRCELLSILHNELVDMLNSGRLRKIELATYQREIERYGGLRALEMSEAVFSADSDAAVHVLRAVQDEFGGDLRVEAALLSADRLLADFGLCSSERLQVITGLQKELRPSLATDHTLKDQMLKESKRIDNRLLNHIEEPPARLGTVDVGFKRRSLNITPIVLQLKALATNSPVIDPVNIVSQYVHMTINRIVREKHAEHEKQIYEWLVTLYRSQIARERVTKPPEPTAENSPGEAEGFGIDLRRKTR
jgi:thiopeptide-type bacteriocin biosynthesis protein